MRNDFGWQHKDSAAYGGPPVRELMKDGEWLVDPKTVKLAPPPREESRQQYAAVRSFNFVGEVNR